MSEIALGMHDQTVNASKLYNLKQQYYNLLGKAAAEAGRVGWVEAI